MIFQKEHLIYVITDDADWAKNEFKDKDWYFLPNDHGLTFDQHNYWITGPDIGKYLFDFTEFFLAWLDLSKIFLAQTPYI